MARIIRASSLDAKVAIALIAFSGLRPEVLEDYEGKDGLRIGDFLEVDNQAKKVKFKRIPTLVRV
ncbi:MAG: hypothetical protein QW589_02850 [Candidatus Bathyarchaeia archaeon]